MKKESLAQSAGRLARKQTRWQGWAELRQQERIKSRRKKRKRFAIGAALVIVYVVLIYFLTYLPVR